MKMYLVRVCLLAAFLIATGCTNTATPEVKDAKPDATFKPDKPPGPPAMPKAPKDAPRK